MCNIPLSDASMNGWCKNFMELCQIHSIPIQKGQGSYGIGMRLIHIIPIPDTVGNLWNCAKNVAINDFHNDGQRADLETILHANEA